MLIKGVARGLGMLRGVDAEGLPKAAPTPTLLWLMGLSSSRAVGHGQGKDLTFEEQFRNAVEKIGKILNAAGSSLSNVVKVTVYLADAKYFSDMNRLFQEYFPHRPARTTVVTGMIDPKALVEVDVIAVVKA
jgi:Putative translation initiation inhibitor, yjgF family